MMPPSLMHRPLAVALCGLVLLATPSRAQSPANGQTEKLVDELQSLLEKGERERLADPWFLKDLRAVIERYDNPWQVVVFEDDFSARGPEPASPWQVVRGEFLLDWRHGLRSVVPGAPAAAEPEPGKQQQKLKGEDVAAALLGALVQKALTGNDKSSRGQGSSAPAADEPAAGPGEPATVVATVVIPNAFKLSVELTARALSGVARPRLEVGPYQGADMSSGYRLIHESGASPAFTLVASSRRGVSTVDIVDGAIDLTDNKPHRLEWARDRNGRMRISLDGKLLIDVVDRRFRDPFDGLAVVNEAGDFALRSVRIDGER